MNFKKYEIDELLRIWDACVLLQSYGIEQDEGVIGELKEEIKVKKI